MGNVVATAKIDIEAPADRVWAALTEPAQIKAYFFGTDVETDWKPGSTIFWKGEYEGSSYQDKGEIVEVDMPRLLKMTHFSPMTGQPDVPENYHTLTYELNQTDSTTHVSLSQDNNDTDDEADRATATWVSLLEGLKKYVESK